MKCLSNARLYLALPMCFAVLCIGCTSSEDVQPPAIPDLPDLGSLDLDPNHLPEGWTSSELSINHLSSGDRVDIVIRGRDTKLKAVIDGIRDRLSTAIMIDEAVDENAKLKSLEIHVTAGSWDDLPKKIADAYGFQLSARDGEIRIVRSDE